MIDILQGKKEFKKYVEKYNVNDGKIALKIAHTYRTADMAKNTAISLNLNQEDTELAELIGLLHDIGRFEQLKIYNTYSDKNSINHAEFGVKLLFQDGLIRNFIKDNKYDAIIEKAIINHNRAKVVEGLTERELLHSKIIRDSDKTDIFKFLIEDKIENVYCVKDMSNETITPEILEMFFNVPHIIDYKKMTSHADNLVAHFAYVFDFNYNYGLKIINDNGYLDKLYNRVYFKNEETQEQIKIIYEYAKEYIEKRIKE